MKEIKEIMEVIKKNNNTTNRIEVVFEEVIKRLRLVITTTYNDIIEIYYTGTSVVVCIGEYKANQEDQFVNRVTIEPNDRETVVKVISLVVSAVEDVDSWDLRSEIDKLELMQYDKFERYLYGK